MESSQPYEPNLYRCCELYQPSYEKHTKEGKNVPEDPIPPRVNVILLEQIKSLQVQVPKICEISSSGSPDEYIDLRPFY
jgi:hypothetical protein